MKIQSITMVHPIQIVKKGYKGCRSTQTVKNFTQKNRVPHVWYKPRGSQNKIMLIELSCFRDAWKGSQTQTQTRIHGTRSKRTTPTSSRTRIRGTQPKKTASSISKTRTLTTTGTKNGTRKTGSTSRSGRTRRGTIRMSRGSTTTGRTRTRRAA